LSGSADGFLDFWREDLERARSLREELRGISSAQGVEKEKSTMLKVMAFGCTYRFEVDTGQSLPVDIAF
jgi:hypothetical protein